MPTRSTLAVPAAPADASARLAAALESLRATERLAAYRTIALWWLGSRALVFATALTAQALRWPKPGWYPSLEGHHLALLTTWDGRWYRMVASRGYLAIPHHQSDTAFFPLYPALLRAAHATGMSLDTAGLLLSNAALLVAICALYELARCWCENGAARRAAVYAAFFPVGYVFSMVYPEALVLAAIALAGVFAHRRRWSAAAVAAAVAALTRPSAFKLRL